MAKSQNKRDISSPATHYENVEIIPTNLYTLHVGLKGATIYYKTMHYWDKYDPFFGFNLTGFNTKSCGSGEGDQIATTHVKVSGINSITVIVYLICR